MYRKKLMRACLTGLMVVTVATANVAPVFAADTAATESNVVTESGTVIIVDENGEAVAVDKEVPAGVYNYSDFETSLPEGYVFTENGTFEVVARKITSLTATKGFDSDFAQGTVVKLNYYDELNKKQAAEVEVLVDKKEGEAVDWSVITANVPAGYKINHIEGDNFVITGGYVYISVTPEGAVDGETGMPGIDASQEVKINYYDEAAKKQVAEVPVVVSQETSAVDMATITRNLPAGYTIEGSDCAIRDGYVYVSVAPMEEVQNVKINYYDEAAKKQVAEVPVQVSIDTSCVNMAILTRYLPEGYTIEGTDCIIRDGYVYVSVAPAEEVQNVKINYYDEDAEKQVAEVPVQVSIDTSCVNMAILTRYMPEGYALVSSDCIIRDGYVYVSVKKDVEIREAVLHITFETPNGEVVTTETVTAEGADGEDAVFRLGVDFNLPTGYKLSNDRDQVTEIKIPFGSTGGHTMVVEKGDLSSIVKIQFVDAENNDEVVAGGDYFVDGDGDGIFHTREITEWIPEGYELQEVGDFQVELYKETPLQLSVTKIKEDKPETPDPEEPNKPEKPETPDQEKPGKPEKPNKEDDKKEDKKDEKKNSPKTGDETNAAAAALPAGVSLAAILAVLVKKFK